MPRIDFKLDGCLHLSSSVSFYCLPRYQVKMAAVGKVWLIHVPPFGSPIQLVGTFQKLT